MIVTVSENNKIKQYSLPDNIKKIAYGVVGGVSVLVLSLGFYTYKLGNKINTIESNNKQLIDQSKKNETLEEQLASLREELNIAVQANSDLTQEYNSKLMQVKTIIDIKAENMYQAKLEAEESAAQDHEKLAKLELEREREELEKQKKLALSKSQKAENAIAEAEKKIKLAEAKVANAEKKRKLAQEKIVEAEKQRKIAERQRREAEQKLAREKSLSKKKVAIDSSLKSKASVFKKIATSKLGGRYVWGSMGPKTFDCSGFTSYIYKSKGITLPRTSSGQSQYGSYINKSQLKVGDLIFFDTSRRGRGVVNHVGMYIGGNQFIHASSAEKKVVITSLNKPFYAKRFKWGRRISN